ncbi:MAG: NUDIX hydrolase [Archangium sp.]
MGHSIVTEIDVVEDFTSTGRCDEGFLHVRRLRVRNVRNDGTNSAIYRVDVIDRPRLDAVAVLVWRRAAGGVLEFLTRQNLRPAAYFRKEKVPNIPDGRTHLFCEEIVAGLLEEEDKGEDGLKIRAALEVREESGFDVDPTRVQLLGAPFFVAPGIISEKIFLTAVEVTGLDVQPATGDGSPLEEGGVVTWRSFSALQKAIADGVIQDAKTEIALRRFMASTVGTRASSTSASEPSLAVSWSST